MINNIEASTHPNIYINFTISKLSISNIEESTRRILAYEKIRGLLFHLYTPYVGLKDQTLELAEDERELAIVRIGQLKRKYPLKISNTFAGIRALKQDNWKRPTWASVVSNQGDLSMCCCRRGISNQEVCEKCGCTPAVETWVLQTLRPTAIIENFRFL